MSTLIDYMAIVNSIINFRRKGPAEVQRLEEFLSILATQSLRSLVLTPRVKEEGEEDSTCRSHCRLFTTPLPLPPPHSLLLLLFSDWA